MFNEIHEECGVFGVYSESVHNIAPLVYYGLFALQHRGQESCGIVVNHNGVFNSHKDIGLVNEVFTPDVLRSLGDGNIAVGHVRYGTTGGGSRANCQPIEVHHIKGTMAVAHNGNLTNAAELRNELELNGSIFHTTSDTEIIAYTVTKERLTHPSIEEAVSAAMDKLEGAYSLIIMSPSKLVAVRDKHGLRPLCYGQRPDGSYVVASESCALNAVGATFIRNIRPGEIVVFSRDGIKSMTEHCNKAEPSLCLFEYIYIARPDSVIDGVSVHDAHIKAGEYLAMEHPVDADVVIGVPDSGIDAALGYSRKSGIPYGIGFVKNKYIGRTFISPGQSERENLVRIKLNPIESAIRGKRVILVDDSIVRGTTSGRIVKLVRDAGAAEVHMRISSPPFVSPCYYGIDIDSCDNLIACHHSVEEIAKIIGADTLGYLSLDHAKSLAGNCTHCTACFDAHYPTSIPCAPCKNRFETPIEG
ncbi:MAG: amidophosphoribosyltransferase [Clostridiales bacterium]|nr:amidophosphoribosyltransferase [Clostridiales bacterium]